MLNRAAAAAAPTTADRNTQLFLHPFNSIMSTTTLDLSKVPASDPPPGVTANFESPENQNYQIYSINIALCLTGTVVLLLRLYTRMFLQKTIAIDDCKLAACIDASWVNQADGGAHQGFASGLRSARGFSRFSGSSVSLREVSRVRRPAS